MDAGVASIIVAVITVIGGVIISIIEKFRKENKKDHDTVMAFLTDLHDDVEKVDQKLDNHIQWHLDKK